MKHYFFPMLFLVGFAFQTHARVGGINLERLVTEADLIGVGEVVELKELKDVKSPKSGKPAKIARIKFVELWKGTEPDEVWIRAFGTWTCDVTYAPVGEKAVFFLESTADSPRNEYEKLPYFSISHSGYGRMPISSVNQIDHVEFGRTVIMPEGMSVIVERDKDNARVYKVKLVSLKRFVRAVK